MKIKVIARMVKELDIGELDTVGDLGVMTERTIEIRKSRPFVCCGCRKKLSLGDSIIVGIKEGRPNMVFHEPCLDEVSARELAKSRCREAAKGESK